MFVATVRAVAMIVFIGTTRDPFECVFATPPRPPAGGPRGSIFLDLGSTCSLIFRIVIVNVVNLIIKLNIVISNVNHLMICKLLLKIELL